MKHNFLSPDVKRQALDEYLEGMLTIRQISEKYEISEGTLYLYKKKNADYVKEYHLKVANKKSEIANTNNNKIKSKNETDEYINFMLADEKPKNKKDTDNFIDYVLSNNNQQPNTKPVNNNDDKAKSDEKAKPIIDNSKRTKKKEDNTEAKQPNPIKPRVRTPKPVNNNVKKKLKIVSYEDEIAKLINEAYTPK